MCRVHTAKRDHLYLELTVNLDSDPVSTLLSSALPWQVFAKWPPVWEAPHWTPACPLPAVLCINVLIPLKSAPPEGSGVRLRRGESRALYA